MEAWVGSKWGGSLAREPAVIVPPRLGVPVPGDRKPVGTGGAVGAAAGADVGAAFGAPPAAGGALVGAAGEGTAGAHALSSPSAPTPIKPTVRNRRRLIPSTDWVVASVRFI